MKINSVKNIKPGSQLPKKILAIALSLSIIAGAYYILNNAGKDARNTIDIIRVRSSDGIPAKSLVTKDMLEKYPLIKREYTSDMLTYDKIDSVLNKYSLYYIRNKSFLYQDQLTDEKPLKNEWLYELDKDMEVLTMPYDYLKCGGDILVPGDLVRVRVAYATSQTQSVAASGLNPGYETEKTVRKTDVVLDSIKVRDQLNSSGHSVYEVYKDIMKLSPEQRQEAMNSRDFMEKITAKALVLEVTSDQVKKYAHYSGVKDAAFLITLLSRKDNKNILDETTAITKEMQSWMTEKN